MLPAHSRGNSRPLRGGSRAPPAGSRCQGDRIVGLTIGVDMSPGICLGCRGPRRFPLLPSLPHGLTCGWLGSGAAAGRIPCGHRTPHVAGKPSRRIEGTQAGRRAKATAESERSGIISDFTVGSQFPPMPYDVQALPARRSCAVLSGANGVSESGNAFVIGSGGFEVPPSHIEIRSNLDRFFLLPQVLKELDQHLSLWELRADL